MNCRSMVACMTVICCWLAMFCRTDAVASDAGVENNEKKIVFIAGPCSHPPGTHEAIAGSRLLKHCIDNAKNIGSIKTAFFTPWPEDSSELDGAAAIVFLGDTFPPASLAKEKPDIEAKLKTLIEEQSCGIVCIHYANGLRESHLPAEGEHPLLAWLGGYFAHDCTHHQSLYGTFHVEFAPTGDNHPIHRGWKSFKCEEEVYYNIYFGKRGPAQNVTPIVCCKVPPEKPRNEIIGWAVVRTNGGRGVGITFPHFFRSWEIDDMRTVVLNSIVWSARIEVPDGGVKSSVPDIKTFLR